MVEALRPSRGGFLRPFGCGWFIKEFLLGHGPYDSPGIDPNRTSHFVSTSTSCRIDSDLGRPELNSIKHYSPLLSQFRRVSRLDEP